MNKAKITETIHLMIHHPGSECLIPCVGDDTRQTMRRIMIDMLYNEFTEAGEDHLGNTIIKLMNGSTCEIVLIPGVFTREKRPDNYSPKEWEQLQGEVKYFLEQLEIIPEQDNDNAIH